MMYSYELERQCLAALINHPDSFIEISSLITEDDFFSANSQVNSTIFSVLKNSIEGGSKIDYVILSERINSLGLSFEDNINISDYIQALSLRKTTKATLVEVVKELKKLSVRRQICEASSQIAKRMQSASTEDSFVELIEDADKIYNDSMSIYDNGVNIPEDLFSNMEDLIEERGNNPVDEFGLLGPHKRLHQLFGSLLRPGNITTITARSGVGKTQFCLDFCLKTSELNGHIPILHLDNGEMSKEELMGRLCSSMSGVPLHLIETGKWRKAGSDTVNKIRSVWKKIKQHKLHYFNVGGMSSDQMINLTKRFYYSKVKRGNEMILNFDYIKTTSEKLGNKNEWQVVGEMVDKFKKLVQRDVLFDGSPMIAMMTSVQSNRTGITNNRRADNIVEDESIVSLSDRITQFSSHLFSLRQKSEEEMLDAPEFGTHKLTCFKHRHLGSEYYRAIQPVRMEDDSLKRNCVYLTFNNFNITEDGDLQDLVNLHGAGAEARPNTGNNQLPI